MSRSTTRELDPLIDQFEHLASKRRGADALHMLRKIASMVKPIMRQRSWRVGTLAEFYPSETSLLGLNTNRGDRIDLRLRYPGDDTQFLPLEEVLDTMLHELCHIVHGPHDRHFHALWAKLRDEQEALISKGYSGEGFLGKGERLGGQRIPMQEMRRRARVAAEQRAVRNKNSGSRLGGAGVLRGQNARDVIAAAAEKRTKIERGCANGTEQGRKIAQGTASKGGQFTTTRAEQEDENEAAWIQAMIELVQEDEAKLFGKDYTPPSQSNPVGGLNPANLDSSSLREEQASLERNIKQQTQHPKPSTPTPARARAPSPVREATPESWTCDVCTLINPIDHLMCGACETERPGIYAKPTDSSSRSKPRAGQTSTRSTPTALQPRLNAYDSLARIESQAARKKEKPIGWICHGCGNWMEEMWWTCANCGMMKASS